MESQRTNTKVWKATVKSNFDVNKKGTLSVEVEGWANNPVDVVYVSPYYTNSQGGLIAVPGHGAEILIMGIENSDSYYYAGSIVDKKSTSNLDAGDPVPISGDKVLPEEASYSDNFTPEKLVVKTPKGHSLTMSDEWDKNKNNMHVNLKTKLGKSLMMHDGPEVGAILLKNEGGDGLTVGGMESSDYPTRGIMLQSKSDQLYQSAKGSIDIVVSNGGELNIENDSNGTNYLAPFFLNSGCINIASKYRDINITNKAFFDFVENRVVKPGRVMIHAGKGLQLECTEGEVIIHSAKKISIASEGDIDMQSATGNINLHAVLGDVNIKAGKNLNLEGTLMAQIHSEIIALNNAAAEGMWTPIPKSGALLVKPLPTTPALPATPSIIEPDANGDPYIPDPGI